MGEVEKATIARAARRMRERLRSTPPTLVFPTIPRHRKLFQKERQARPRPQPIQTRSAAKSRAGAGSETGAIRPRLVAPTPDLGAQPWAIEFRVTTVTVFATNVSLCIGVMWAG